MAELLSHGGRHIYGDVRIWHRSIISRGKKKRLKRSAHRCRQDALQWSTSEQLLCMVAKNAPVLAMSGPGTGMIIVGYTTWGVIGRDIASGAEQTISYEGVNAMTEGSGYTYVSYV